MAVTVTARDGSLNLLGAINWSKVDLTLRYNEVGTWTLTLPATPQNYAFATTPDLGIFVDWNGSTSSPG